MELGSMIFALRLCKGKTGRKLLLLGRLREFIEGDLALSDTHSDECLEDLEKLVGLRNPAVHSSTFGEDKAHEAKELTIRILNRFRSSE